MYLEIVKCSMYLGQSGEKSQKNLEWFMVQASFECVRERERERESQQARELSREKSRCIKICA